MIVNNELSAEVFLEEIKKANLTGREFLALIGNSKLDNNAYLEIKDGTNLTKERLYRIFEESALTSADYYRMLSAAFELKRRKEEKARDDNEKKLRNEIDEANKRRSEAKIAEWKEENAAKKLEKKLASDVLAAQTPYQPEGSAIKLDDEKESDDTDFDDVNSYENDYDANNKKNKRETLSAKDFYNDDGDNKGRIAVSLCLAFALFLSSFAFRYYNTGSFFPEKIGPVEISTLETYLDLAKNIFKLPDLRETAPKLTGKHYINTGETPAIAGKNSVKSEDYAFYIYGNTLYALDLNSKDTEFAFEITKSDMVLNSFYVFEDKLYVIYDYTYSKSYVSNSQIGNESEETDENENEEAINTISGKFDQHSTAVDVYSVSDFTATPILSYTLDGVYKSIGNSGNKVYISTDFTPFDPAMSDDTSAYIPMYSVDGQINNVPIENITLSDKAESRCMTVVGFIGDSTPVAAVGGEYSDVCAFENSLFILLGKGKTTEILRYGPEMQSKSYLADGTVYSTSIDETNGIIRFCSETDNGVALSVLNSEMELLSLVNNIALGEKLASVLFDGTAVYMIGERIYIVDTDIPEEPIIAERMSTSVYSDDYYYWSDKERILLEYITDGDGAKTGLKMSVYKLERGEYTQTATTEIGFDISIAGNWSSFVRSPIDNESYELFLMPEKGLLIIPVSYFNGISEINRFIILEYSEHTGIYNAYEYYEYDSHSEKMSAVISDGEQVYLLANDRIKTFNLSEITGYTNS